MHDDRHPRPKLEPGNELADAKQPSHEAARAPVGEHHLPLLSRGPPAGYFVSISTAGKEGLIEIQGEKRDLVRWLTKTALLAALVVTFSRGAWLMVAAVTVLRRPARRELVIALVPLALVGGLAVLGWLPESWLGPPRSGWAGAVTRSGPTCRPNTCTRTCSGFSSKVAC
jgi:hypothetical protein